MKLLLSDPTDNWDLYDTYTFVMAVAKEGSGSSNSIFGSYAHFKRYVDYNCNRDESFINNLTDHGLKIYREHGGKR